MLFGLWKKHEGWPYPRGKQQVTEAALVIIGIVVIAAVGWGLWQWHASHLPLSSDEIHIAASDLSGYAGEALLLARDTDKQPLAGNYRAAYVKQLQKDIAQTARDLTKKSPEPEDATRVAQLLQYDHELSGLLNTAAASYNSEVAGRLENLQTNIQDMEGRQ